MTNTTVSTPTTTIMEALDASLSKIQEVNPNVPKALAVVIGTGKGKFHGMFTPDSWQDSGGEHKGSARHEIIMSSESLRRDAELILTTLIHETAHAMSHATGIKDTSRQGRFHNAKFAEVANSMGLRTETDPKIGHVTTGLMDYAIDLYKNEIELIRAATITYRKPVEKKPTKKTTIRVACACGVPVTVPIKWWDDFGQDNLICSLCEDSGDDRTFKEVE